MEHHAANNLGAQAAQLLRASAIERGSYKNRFTCTPAARPVVPRHMPKPTEKSQGQVFPFA